MQVCTRCANRCNKSFSIVILIPAICKFRSLLGAHLAVHYATALSRQATASLYVWKHPTNLTTSLFSILRTPKTPGAAFLMSNLPSIVDQQVDVNFTISTVAFILYPFCRGRSPISKRYCQRIYKRNPKRGCFGNDLITLYGRVRVRFGRGNPKELGNC